MDVKAINKLRKGRSNKEMKKGVTGVLAVMMVFVSTSVIIYAQQATAQKHLRVEEERKQEVDELRDIKNPEAAFKVELWTNRKDATYWIGDKIVFFFKTNKGCRLTLFHVSTTGKVHMLFPNKYQKDNLVKAGMVYQIPPEKVSWILMVGDPAGVALIKAIVTLEKIDLVTQADTEPAGPVQEVTKPQSQLAKDIAIKLKAVDTNRWAEAEKILNIVK